MSNAIVDALERAAKQIVEALGKGVKEAEQKLLHSTADNLEQAAKRHVEYDAKAAEDIESAGRGMHASEDVHGGGASPVPVETESGAGSGLAADLPGATELPNPDQRLSTQDYPYLRSPSADREVEAIHGTKPATTARITADPGDGPVPTGDVLKSFSGDVSPGWVEPGQTIYRVVGDGTYPTGGFWSRARPQGESELRDDYAVLNEWNGDHGVVAYTPTERVRVWEGEVAPQLASGGSDDYYLPGGAQQIWIPRGNVIGSNGLWEIAPMPEGASS